MSETKTLSLDERIKAVENNLPTLFLKYPQHLYISFQKGPIGFTDDNPPWQYQIYKLDVSRKTTNETLFEMSHENGPEYSKMILRIEAMLDELFFKPSNGIQRSGWDLFNAVILKEVKQRYLKENPKPIDGTFQWFLLENGMAVIKTGMPEAIVKWLETVNIETEFRKGHPSMFPLYNYDIYNIADFPGDEVYTFFWIKSADYYKNHEVN